MRRAMARSSYSDDKAADKDAENGQICVLRKYRVIFGDPVSKLGKSNWRRKKSLFYDTKGWFVAKT